MSYTADLLEKAETLLENGLDTQRLLAMFELLGAPSYPPQFLEEFRLRNEFLPMSQTAPYTQQQRYLHLLWETLDLTPLSSNLAFSLPLRQMIGKRLFKRCGQHFCCSEGVRFNFGNLLEIGDDVLIDAGCTFDTKGGLSIGSHTVIAEHVTIFTHDHGEEDHVQRRYAKVHIGQYVKLAPGCHIRPGATIGNQAIVGTNALVTQDVPENMVAAGSPAKVLRPRRSGGKEGEALNHYYFINQQFQTD